ncbi:hypothetical protein IB229_12905 [Pseudomonas sp. PDM14]|uniref:hypothetical protein n=1 Tax=Pseudomonas sp. PDM14 TaxID=2769288 RepID=UPI0017857959|nr:hypothetical protein [Pseudomonas sp. PDM14]MBD9483878.1 hypothetical protein [Pseudomonas sp. PDM14]
MTKALEIRLQLTQEQAQALLEDERQRLRMAFNEHWYADRYRYTPAGLRSKAILADYPALAGHKRTIGALRAALTQAQ